MARVCIITALHPSLNPRVVKEADTLSAFGYDVSVIAPDFSKWARDADLVFKSRPWRVVAAPKFGPLGPPLARIRELVRRAVAGVLVNKFRFTGSWLVNAAAHPVAPGLIRAAKKVKADLYIGHYIAGLAAAAVAARKNDAKYAFDAEDFHLGDPPEGQQYDNRRRIIRLIEERYLSGAAYISAAAPGIAEAYADAYKMELPTVVLNVFSKNATPEKTLSQRSNSKQASLYWFSQTIGPDRGLECAVRAIAYSKTKPRLALRGFPNALFVKKLKDIAQSLGVVDRLTILDPANPSEMEQLASEHDVGYVGETGHSPNRRIMLTNKQFTYMLAGLPSIMSDIPSHVRFAKEAPGAVRIFKAEDPGSLAEAIDEILGDTDHLLAMRREAFHLGQKRFNWEVEQKKIKQLVDDVFR